jgi:hypothetical protein
VGEVELDERGVEHQPRTDELEEIVVYEIA